LLSPQPYKHPKTTKLNPNTPWMKQNYKKNIKHWLLLFLTFHESFYIHENPIHLSIVLSDLLYWTFDPNFLHPMPFSIVVHTHNRWIKSSLVNIHLFPSMMLHLEAHFPNLHASKPNTWNNCSEANLTKASFGNGGHCFATIITFTHSYSALPRARLVTFWWFHLCTT
jgi:hypothetical protein